MLDSNFSFDLPRAVTYFYSHFFEKIIFVLIIFM